MYGKIPVFVCISRIMSKCMIKNGSGLKIKKNNKTHNSINYEMDEFNNLQ